MRTGGLQRLQDGWVGADDEGVGHLPGIMAQGAGQLRTGDVLAGYRIERLLGRGGMGVVYLAEHLHLGRRAALKLIAPEHASAAGFRERFAAEARAAAALHHPHVVGVYDAGESDGRLYLAMQHVDGRDLEDILRERGALDVQRAITVCEQVGSALDAAHGAGLVHRDVKPANVLLEGSHAYLADFGLARRAATATRRLVGTVDYVAPEQVEGRPVDARADVYALGAVLFHLLAGVPPFVRDSEVAVLYAHVHERPPRLTSLRPELPSGAGAALATALAKRPGDRPASCAELVGAVRAELAAAGLLTAAATPARVVPRGGDEAWTATVVDRPAGVPAAPAAADLPVVLVVSADPGVLALVRVALAGARVRVAEAADVPAALARALAEEPALAIVDWSLPGGATALARGLHASVLAICDPDRISRAEARAGGAQEVVEAPFSPVQLHVRLRRLLGAEALADHRG